MQDDRAVESRQRGGRLDARRATVDDDRQVELLREGELGVEQQALLA